MESSVAFTSRIEKGQLSVSQLVQSEATACVTQNQEKLPSILKTIIFCGKQNIALRGHREGGGTGQNPGNFLALLDFRVDSGDTILANHFKECPRNAQYKSPTIQNELIACTGEWIRNHIIQEVIEARFFSVCADEVTDVANKEQLPLVVRFVDRDDTIREEFVDFVVCDTGTTGVASTCCQNHGGIGKLWS